MVTEVARDQTWLMPSLEWVEFIGMTSQAQWCVFNDSSLLGFKKFQILTNTYQQTVAYMKDAIKS